MSPTRLLITGCPRSGTHFFDAVLNRIGVPCQHEVVYGFETLAPDSKLHAHMRRKRDRGHYDWKPGVSESSWLAVPYLDEVPADVAVVHVVRHPAEQIRSAFVPMFSDDSWWWGHYYMTMSGVTRNQRRLVENAAACWVYWNRTIEKSRKAVMRVRLEDVGPETFRTLGSLVGVDVSPEDAAAAVQFPSGVPGKHGAKYDGPVDLLNHLRPEIRTQLNHISRNYGYDLQLLEKT